MTDSPGNAQHGPDRPPGARLQDSQDQVRLAAVAELLMADIETLPPLESATPCLDDSNHEVRRLAVEVLLRYGPGAVPALIQALGVQQPVPVRIAAASALARLGPEASPAIEPLCRGVQTEDAMLRWHASYALGKIGSAAVPQLRQLLQSPDHQTAAAALDALEWIGPEAKEAREDVEKLAAETPSPHLQLACTTALIKITDDLASAKPILVELLAKGDAGLRKACVRRLAALGVSGGEYEECLLQACQDPSAEVRGAAALAVATILEDPAKPVSALTGLLSDPEPEVRGKAAMGLARYGPEASPALPMLRELQHQSDEGLAATASAAIEKIVGTGPPA